jgi:hypothetical protein
MADEIFVMHRRVLVRSPVFVAGTKGVVGWAPAFGETLTDSVAFEAREATDDEAKSSAQKLKDDVDRRVAELQMKAAVDAQVAELRLEAAVDRRVEQLQMQAAVDRRVEELRKQGQQGDD